MRESAETDRRATLAERAPIERELAEVWRKLERAQVMCLDSAIDTAELKKLSEPHRARLAVLQKRLAVAVQPPSPIQLHPQAAEAYRRLAANLHIMLERNDADNVKAELCRLIERPDFTPVPAHSRFTLRVHGRLADLLRVSEGPGACEVVVGAGTGFEPVTFRL